MRTAKGIVAALGLALGARAASLQIGAWVGGSGTYPQPTQANVEAFETLQGRNLDFVQVYAIWDSDDWAWTRTYADIADSSGATLLVTWMPNGYSAPDILAGTEDAYIAKYAHDIKGYGHEVWIRTLHEANGNWYSWGVANSSGLNTDSNVAAAYRHIVGIFQDSGVANVKWVWTTSSSNSSGATFAGNYPGDAYCDYVSIDGYNWGTSQTVAADGWASSWQTFAQVFSASYQALASIDKPLFIPEFGSSEKGGDKAQWIRDAFASVSTTFPRIFALMWFNQSSDADWALTTSDSATLAWKECVAEYASSPSAGIAHVASHDPATFARALGNGRIGLELGSDASVRIRVSDLRGSLLDRRDLGSLPAGSHVLDLGRAHGIRLVTVQAGSRTATLRLAGG